MQDKIEKALDKARAYVMTHGGNIELVDAKEGVVTVRLTRACVGCPDAPVTLKMIERTLKQEIPQVKEVRAI